MRPAHWWIIAVANSRATQFQGQLISAVLIIYGFLETSTLNLSNFLWLWFLIFICLFVCVFVLCLRTFEDKYAYQWKVHLLLLIYEAELRLKPANLKKRGCKQRTKYGLFSWSSPELFIYSFIFWIISHVRLPRWSPRWKIKKNCKTEEAHDFFFKKISWKGN